MNAPLHRARRGPQPTPGTVRTALSQTLRVPESPGPVVGSVCTGYGGLDLGVLAALGGGRIAWCADPDPHIRQILDARMPGVPNLGDLRVIDWTAVEPVDVFTAGWPCQDISAAGRRAGIEKGARSGLWTNVVEGIRILRPALCVLENVSALRWRNGGLHRVLGDLAEAGYDALWHSVRAADIGCAHRRERVFLLAWPRTPVAANAADSASTRWRSPRCGRPGTPPRAGAPGQPARRGERRCEAVAHADGDQPERRRGSQPLAATSGEAPRTRDQRQRDGHAVVHRGQVAVDSHGVGRESVHPLHPRWWPIADGSVPTPADAGHVEQPRTGAADGPPADTASDRRNQGLSSATRFQGRPDAAVGDHPTAVPRHAERHCLASEVDSATELTAPPSAAHAVVDWGEYAPAVQRWERLLGRPAPYPTQPGQHGRPVLAPAFVEHLMGLPRGWITDLALPRTAQLRALGNGVVPAQAAHAVSLLLADLTALLADERSGIGREAAA